jgi:hypothetical protein
VVRVAQEGSGFVESDFPVEGAEWSVFTKRGTRAAWLRYGVEAFVVP